jgi:hypothetical protein
MPEAALIGHLLLTAFDPKLAERPKGELGPGEFRRPV